MKTIARVKFCECFIKALKNTKNSLTCSHWTNDIEADDTDIKTVQPKKSLDIELSLFDYFFNVSCEEEEISVLWLTVRLIEKLLTLQRFK